MGAEATIGAGVNEPAIRQALNIYYSRFGTEQSVTLRRAAALAGIPDAVAYLHSYIADQSTCLGIGMPETRDEARHYLTQLQQSQP